MEVPNKSKPKFSGFTMEFIVSFQKWGKFRTFLWGGT